ncbi:sensor histidine kinase [Delftia tsuruhatensis]|uniref:sensor histidine kinase n=1 Tax=Delftia tsuruhatensis TaxID=180282 RepID=UPI0020917284|nr:ATP-binding protein [Delftia tsuruhatensis]MCR4544294.1 ATP-binding protein [Delftia tsuruhatensis]
MAKLRPRARIVRTIGDQLISGPEAALIELVKNAYDADSAAVRISITPPRSIQSGREPGKIVVADTGHGMSAQDLIGKWFEPATTDKLERQTSPGKRRLLGAKGVGRFATARLGRLLHLKCASKKPGKLLEVSEISIDWRDFETSEYLDEVDIEVTTRTGFRGEVPGVTLEISELRDPWTKEQLELLIRELRRLASPQNAKESGFKIFLDLTGFTVSGHGFDGQSLISGIFGSAESDVEGNGANDATEIRPFSLGNVFHYRVEGSFNSAGAFSGRFVNQRADGQTQALTVPAPDIASSEELCGPVHLTLNIYDREGDAVVDLFKKLGLSSIGRVDARKVLDENIGVGIYRNGFRIRPYGDAESDWLELESKRVQNPSQKLGLNQLWGIVRIADEDLSGLIERSSREGLEHNGSFIRLKRQIADVMTRVEALRVDFREMVGISRKQEGDTGGLRNQAGMQATAKAIASLPPRYRDKIQKALRQESVALNNSLDDLEAYQHKLAAQSSLGLVVSQVLHDGRRFLGDINTRSKGLADGAPRLLEQSKFGEHFRESFEKNARSIHESAGNLTKLFRALDPLASRKRGRPKVLDPMVVVDRCLSLFADAITANGISVSQFSQDGLPKVTVYEADLMAAVLNIVDNAVHWLGTSPHKPRELKVTTTYSKKWVRIALSNNGPGIDELLAKSLFKPGFTLKPEGSGLGLAIAREAMQASKGKVVHDPEAEQTTFVIEIQRS